MWSRQNYSLSLVEEDEFKPSPFLPIDQQSFQKAESIFIHVVFLSQKNLEGYGKFLLVFTSERYAAWQENKQCHILDPKQWLFSRWFTSNIHPVLQKEKLKPPKKL